MSGRAGSGAATVMAPTLEQTSLKALVVCFNTSNSRLFFREAVAMPDYTIEPSFGVDFKLWRSGDKKLQVWSISGQERVRVTTKSYFRCANALIIPVNVTEAEMSRQLYLIKESDQTIPLIFAGSNRVVPDDNGTIPAALTQAEVSEVIGRVGLHSCPIKFVELNADGDKTALVDCVHEMHEAQLALEAKAEPEASSAGFLDNCSIM